MLLTIDIKSLCIIVWPEAESNCRPLVFQTSALPTELSGLCGGDDGIRTRDLLRDRQNCDFTTPPYI